MEDIKLYSEIEHLIIAWNIDGTKTAGSLTREIMKLLNNEVREKMGINAYNFLKNEFTVDVSYKKIIEKC